MSALKAKRPSFWKRDYELTLDGYVITRWNPRTWRTGGSFDLDGRTYEIGANGWATRYEMTDQLTGAVVATAERVGRKRWSIEAEGRTYGFERGSFWRQEQHLVIDGRTVGSIRRAHLHQDAAEADLPGLPAHVQVFAFLVVLTTWDLAAAAAG